VDWRGEALARHWLKRPAETFNQTFKKASGPAEREHKASEPLNFFDP
jgi:hypothetical protein